MKNKNKKLSILVALLLLGVGVSFAYFVGKTIFKGTGATLTGTTATLEGAKLHIEGGAEFTDTNIYPGHQTVSKITATAKGEDVIIPFNLILKGNNTLNTNLNYIVYRVEEPLEEGKEIKATCEKETKVLSGKQYLSEKCDISNIKDLEQISSGTIPKQTNEINITIATDQFITATQPQPTVYYYYIILEYPNENKSQNEDLEGSFEGTVEAEISDASADINILSIKVEKEKGTFTEQDTIPNNDGTYILDTTQSTCTNDATLDWDNTTNNLIVNNLHKTGTDCDLYFKQKPTADDTLADLNLSSHGESQRKFTGTACSSGCSITDENGLFEAPDEDGAKSYYFRGTVSNNWVKFGQTSAGKDMYWRIIRINGNGTIRLIYAGEEGSLGNGNGKNAVDNQAYNSSRNDNKYVGFMYGGEKGNSSESYDAAHKNETKSDILGSLYNWWDETNLDSLLSKIDGATGFCNDRQAYDGSSATSQPDTSGTKGYGQVITYYAPYIRITQKKEPTFLCTQKSQDLFTYKEDKGDGNGVLEKPVGLITVDEVMYAGGYYGTNNTGYWLYTNQEYWTMSPYYVYPSGNAYVFLLYNSGQQLYYRSVSNTNFGVRPVINLKANTTFSKATGEVDDPFVVS